jgi:hypothetical protein
MTPEKKGLNSIRALSYHDNLGADILAARFASQRKRCPIYGTEAADIECSHIEARVPNAAYGRNQLV